MDLSMIDEASWEKFKVQFPAAQSFLLNASLKGEYEILKKRSSLNTWETKRLAELETLFAIQSGW